MPQKLEIIVTCHVEMYTTLNVLMASCFQKTGDQVVGTT